MDMGIQSLYAVRFVSVGECFFAMAQNYANIRTRIPIQIYIYIYKRKNRAGHQTHIHHRNIRFAIGAPLSIEKLKRSNNKRLMEILLLTLTIDKKLIPIEMVM